MKLLPKQLEAVKRLHDDTTIECVYGGAAGGGKSALGCLWLIEQCQKYEGTRWLLGRSRLKTLKETTLATFFELATKLDISEQFSYNSMAGTINFNNGSQILLKDLQSMPSDPEFDSLGSLEISGAFIDEISQISEKAWLIVKSRCRYKLNEYGLIPKILGCTNPTRNWVFNRFYKPYSDEITDPSRAFIRALPTDNPHLPQSYLDALLALDEASTQRLYYGNWFYDDDPQKLFDFADVESAFSAEYVSGGQNYISADIASVGADLFVVCVWSGWRLVDIITLNKSDGKQVLDTITHAAKKYKVPAKNIVYDADGIGGLLRGLLRSARAFNNGGKTIGRNNYANLKTQCYFALSKKFESNDIYIKSSKYDSDITDELTSIKKRETEDDTKVRVSSKREIKSVLGRSPDIGDAIMMRCYFDLVSSSRTGIRRIN